MSGLAEREIELRQHRAYGRLAADHTQCSSLEDSLCIVKGRDALLAHWVARGSQEVSITAGLGEMVAFTVSDGQRRWPAHRWVTREQGRILREILVEDSGFARLAPPDHPPLGELRAGQGQFPAGETAKLPPDFPAAARPLAHDLHVAWNGRAFDRFTADWLGLTVATLPDATFYFERACVEEDRIALLWRVFGHHANGQRIRLIGSSLFTIAQSGEFGCDETVLDHAALAAQINRPLLDYSA